MSRHRLFVAADIAPSVEEASFGALIPSSVGNVALKLSTEVEGVRLTQDAIYLRDTPVQLVFGQISDDGRFEPHDNAATGQTRPADGVYSGPGSRIRVY